jgi:hypothetical protein
MMHNEEIERKMNFIVEQRAQFASDIQQLQESQARTEQVVGRTEQVVARTAENSLISVARSRRLAHFRVTPMPNKRLQRTRHERASFLRCVGEPLKRNVRRLRSNPRNWIFTKL